jgi:RNA polymerase sigma-70 factor (ECF subfamily)
MSSPDSFPPPGGPAFPATRWSLILDLRSGNAASAERALEELCRIYWYPVYAFVRREGAGPEDAQDLTQGFFARLLERGDFLTADAEKGRLRTFLLTCAKHHMVRDWRHRSALKRGGPAAAAAGAASLHDRAAGAGAAGGGSGGGGSGGGGGGRNGYAAGAEERYAREPVDAAGSPDELFDRRWALETLEEALGRVEREYAAAGKAELHAALQPFISAKPKAGDIAGLAGRFGMTEGALHVAVHRLRQRFRRSLEELVAETVGSREETGEELRHLLGLIAGS